VCLPRPPSVCHLFEQGGALRGKLFRHGRHGRDQRTWRLRLRLRSHGERDHGNRRGAGRQP
jgi:hypothetical protein